MNSISNALIDWTILGGIIVLCIFGIYRMYLSYYPRNRFQFWFVSIFLGGIVLGILFINELLPGSRAYYDSEFTNRVLGRSTSLTEFYTYDSYREPLLGDGYSLYIYKFDEESSKYLRKPDKSFFKSHPFYRSGKTDWVTKNWTTCPIDAADSSFREFALTPFGFYGEARGTNIEKVEGVIGRMLNKEGNYYAYHAKWGGREVWNISFYVLSPEDGWLIAIYSDM